MYESPLNVATRLATEVEKDLEGKITAKIKKEYNIEVDREELIKALNYDRKQYAKGYEDGYSDGYQAAKEKFIRLIETSIQISIKEIEMSAIKELKACPFCGDEEVTVGIYSLGKAVAVVQCTNCCAAAGFVNVEKFGEELAKEKAVQYWNTRRSEDEQIH